MSDYPSNVLANGPDQDDDEDDALPEDPYGSTSYPDEVSGLRGTGSGYSRRSYAAGRQHSYPGAVPDPNTLQPPGVYRRGFSEDVNEIRSVGSGASGPGSGPGSGSGFSGEFEDDASYGSSSHHRHHHHRRGVADGGLDSLDDDSVRRYSLSAKYNLEVMHFYRRCVTLRQSVGFHF